MIEICNELMDVEIRLNEAVNLLAVFSEFYQEEGYFPEEASAQANEMQKVIFAERMSTFSSVISAATALVGQEYHHITQICERAEQLLVEQQSDSQKHDMSEVSELFSQLNPESQTRVLDAIRSLVA